MGTGAGRVLKSVVPPPRPGIPPPKFSAMRDVNVGVAGGRATVAVTVGKTGATVGVNGKGAINVVGRSVPAVRLIMTETVGAGAGARDGTREVIVKPAGVTCGTVTVTGVMFARGIAAILTGDKELSGDEAIGNREGTPKKVGYGNKNGLKTCAWP